MFPLVGGDFSPVRSGPPPTNSPWRVWASRRATTDCHLLQSTDHSHPVVPIFTATNSVATIALVFINESLTRLGKLYRHDESDVFRRPDD
jgi:hypothetical protein